MPRIRTWDSGRIKKAAFVPRTAARVAKSGAQYAAQRADGARRAGENAQGGGPEEAAANFLSETLTDAERRVVLAPVKMGYGLSKWGLRKYVQHRRAAKHTAAQATPHSEAASPQGLQQGMPGQAPAPAAHGRANLPFVNGASGRGPAVQGCTTGPSANGARAGSMTLRRAKPHVKGQTRLVKQPAGMMKLARGHKASTQASRMAQRAAAKAAAKKSASAAKAAKTAAQKARRATEKAAKATAKLIRATARLALAALRSLVLLLTGTGVPVILVLVFVCAVAMLLGSVFGIFFSGGQDSAALSAVVQEINRDYQKRIDAIQAETDHQELRFTGSRAAWPEILSVYAVLVVTDPGTSQKVVTMTLEKQAILENLFWQMNEITASTSSEPVGGRVVVTLHIAVRGKTAWEMADLLGFDETQREQLGMLLDADRALWREVLYGIGTGDGEIVAVAMSQIGNVGGEPYWSWYGYPDRVEWCACFVSWCADQCGYIEAGVIPKFAGVGAGEDWFKARGLWQNRHYEPSPGDIIFFDWDRDGNVDHVGIVEKVEDGWVYTIEGNSNDACRERRYALGHMQIYGYGTPEYTP